MATGVGAAQQASRRVERRPPKLSFELAEWKLQPPAARPGIVLRTHLIDRLSAPATAPVIAVVAPPGYGKTTLLSQWTARRSQRSSWVTLDERDNDPTVLLTYIAAALDRVERVRPSVFRALSSGGGLAVSALLVAAMAAMNEPFLLVLDHFEAVTNRDCLDAVAAIALRLPPGSQLAIGSRDELPLPTARLRAHGGLVELGSEDLAMDEEEVRGLLDEAGIDLPEPSRRELLERTEGWPVGLYLASLAISTGGPRPEAAAAFTGDDFFVGDYLRSELIDRLEPDEVTFLTRTSILDRMCGPLCDATTGSSASGALLEALESRNLLVLPLDRRREWYRYHHLFRELLASELRRREPELVAVLHRRAASWYEANGLPEAAIGHAQEAGDADAVASLVLRIASPVWASGRGDTVLRWFEWFEATKCIEDHPAVAVHGSLMYALAGRPGDAERWAAFAERTETTGILTDGNTMEATAAYLQALMCRGGIEQMRRDARTAWDGFSPASPYRATMLHIEGMSHLLEGDGDAADGIFARAADEAGRDGAHPLTPVVLAERSIVAIRRNDWARTGELIDEAMEITRLGQFDDYWTSALVYSVAARVAIRRGDLEQGLRHVTRAARLRPLLNYALPVVSVQALLEMARSYSTLGDPGGAGAVLRQAHDILRQRPDLGTLPSEVEQLRSELDTARLGALGASSLTTAELRLLPLLPTHLSFREIGERLYVSRHTVKTQAISIYRKLGVSSRSESITRMHELGLLEPV